MKTIEELQTEEDAAFAAYNDAGREYDRVFGAAMIEYGGLSEHEARARAAPLARTEFERLSYAGRAHAAAYERRRDAEMAQRQAILAGQLDDTEMGCETP